MKSLLFLFSLFLTQAEAAIKTQVIEYKEGDQVLEGYLAYDTKAKGKLPAVLVVHEWMGLGPYAKKRAEMLASMGYVAFAADIYGKGIRPNNPKDAAAESSKYKSNPPLLRARVQAALQELLKQKNVDKNKVAAIGYCFGGTTVLELARANADIKGVVSFHGALSSPAAKDTKEVKAKVLVLHGADDPYVPDAEVKNFEEEMRKAKADWQLVKYSGAVHSFTNPDAGSDNSKGAAYNAAADKRSWAHMKAFFAEIF